ncbi:MAG: T9SS type A sorting domain-containing protein, partial [Bacteroidota bacterium]|nr:T9SS type A sorting domain-containing protein [Bacteroidota bacterium]MDX5431188.1 T9SS type A sorting domain-containing protein [Bacteroidota bacterium]MDX5469927.1 T9SS type A sorting domain-containing protein [Bacteroidota bacterium]
SDVGAPIQENFEFDNFPPLSWTTEAEGAVTWQRYQGAASLGNVSARVVICYTTPAGSTTKMYMPALDMIAINDPVLTFDLAYARRINGSIDRLRVYASTDCGVSWVLIYQRAGIQMETGVTGTTNFIPTSSQWNKHSVNLKNYVGKRNLLLRFDAVTDLGGNLYIDNINVGSLTSAGAMLPESQMSLYPNPANHQATLSVDAFESGELEISMVDVNGKQILALPSYWIQSGHQEIVLDTRALPSGVYLVKTLLNGYTSTQKLVVSH